MKPIQVSEDILPIASFQGACLGGRALAPSARAPMIITQNARPAAVLLSPESSTASTYRERFREAVLEGLADAEAGRVVSDRDLTRWWNVSSASASGEQASLDPESPERPPRNRAIHRPRQSRSSAQMGRGASQAGARSARMPRAGRRVPNWDADDVREVVVRSYRIVYQTFPDGIVVSRRSFESHRQLPGGIGK